MAFASCAPSSSGSSLGVTPSGPAAMRPHKGAAPVIYVANEAGQPNGGTVTVYSLSGTWLRTMHKGITAPKAFAFDKLHDVYVLNAPSKGGGSVAKFSHGGKKFLGRIKNSAIKSPVGLALDSKNNIYVLNGASASTGKGNVLVFAAGTSRLAATIVKGIAKPTQIASDCHGNVYVLNAGSKTVTAYGPKHKINLTIKGMSSSTGLMVTCPGNVYVARSLVTAAQVARGRGPSSATPTPSPTPSSGPPAGVVTEFAAGSTTASMTIPLTEGIPCDMAPNSSDSAVWVMACPASSSGGGTTMLNYPVNMTDPALTINTGMTFDMFAYAVPPGIQQTTLAIPRVAPTSGAEAIGGHSGSYSAMQLEIVSTSYGSSTSATYNIVSVDEPTMGVATAVVAN